MTDDEMVCFAQWCRLNPAWLVLDPVIARRVLAAYDGASTPDEVDEAQA